jgi:hypothetical protein
MRRRPLEIKFKKKAIFCHGRNKNLEQMNTNGEGGGNKVGYPTKQLRKRKIIVQQEKLSTQNTIT